MKAPTGTARPLPLPRAELGLREGYHSPQVPVEVRLNTNESPYPPPPEWLEALLAEARGIAFNRYPDRSARALREALGQLHGVPAEQVFAANGSNEVLQAVCLAYGGPGRKAAMFEPTYALHAPYRPSHRHRDRPGRPATGLHARRRRRRRTGGKARTVHRFSLFPQQPDRLGRGCHHRFRRRRGHGRAGGGGRGLWPVRLVVGAGPGGRGRPPGGGAHLFQDLVHGRAAPRLPDRPVRGRAGPRAGGAALSPRRPQTGGGPVGPSVLGPDGAAGGGRRGRARPPGGVALLPARACLAFAGQLRPLAPARARRAGSLAGTGRSLGPGARHLDLAGVWKVACAPPWAPPRKTTASSPPWPRCWRDRARRPQRAHYQRDVYFAAGWRWTVPAK